MGKKSFLLVNLQEDKAKKLAQVMSNDSCRKILDFLTEKEGTESEISAKLDIPLSTVHYNLQHLQKAGLVVAEEYHYSEKGKEVNHYKLANKYIIIAPKSTYGISEKLKSILPVGLIALGGAFILGFWEKMARGFGPFYSTQEFASSKVLSASVENAPVAEAARSVPMATAQKSAEVAPQVMQVAEDAAAESVLPVVEEVTQEAVQETSQEVLQQVVTTVTEPTLWGNIGLWFFIGALFGLILYMIITSLRKD